MLCDKNIKLRGEIFFWEFLMTILSDDVDCKRHFYYFKDISSGTTVRNFSPNLTLKSRLSSGKYVFIMSFVLIVSWNRVADLIEPFKRVHNKFGRNNFSVTVHKTGQRKAIKAISRK